MHLFIILNVVAMFHLALASVVPHTRRQEPSLVPLSMTDEKYRIADSYIVILKPDTKLDEHLARVGQDLRTTADEFFYMDAINAYSFTMKGSVQIMEDKIRADSSVEAVQQNGRVPLDEAFQVLPGTNPDPDTNYVEKRETAGDITRRILTSRQTANVRGWERKTEQNKIWHMAMVQGDGRLKNLNTKEEKNNYDHITNPDNGAGVNIYIIDSGIRSTHKEFGGRVRHLGGGKDNDPSPYCPGEPNTDQHGHGTHVAGTAAGSNYGISYAATIVNVKSGCKNGFDFDQIARSINDIINEHKKNKQDKPNGWAGSVINMSLGGTMDWGPAFKLACQVAYNEGIPIAVAGGNSNVDAVTFQPCNYASVFCIGASDQNYRRADFSNYGVTLKGYAPGKDIKSADFKSDDGYTLKSGTSMASPMVAGIFAIFLSFETSDLWGDAKDAYNRMHANTLRIIDAHSGQILNQLMVTTGINSPWRHALFPYAGLDRELLQGTCEMSVTEIQTCEDPAHNLFATVAITGPKGEKLFETSQGGSAPGVPIDDIAADQADEIIKTYPGYIINGESDLPGVMQIIGEHDNDYVQMFYFKRDSDDESLAFTAGAPDGVGTLDQGAQKCELADKGNWGDGKAPACKDGAKSRRFVCKFAC
ncbi:peptidase S8/S53 domain-containing protein [Apodospora peruviana]|uniref:Peptidase S8/S53 domain-containing protein n=1 Tax=Apodospora peruviana TaxID=516989 RepID=A0AAE0HWS4_9PEZI|nr:peptidase S8/S53 domain-containing protein [Apodospora peruviana]